VEAAEEVGGRGGGGVVDGPCPDEVLGVVVEEEEEEGGLGSSTLGKREGADVSAGGGACHQAVGAGGKARDLGDYTD